MCHASLDLSLRDGGQAAKRLAIFGAALMLFAEAPAAVATFQGRNGRIAFRRYLNQAQTRGAIFTIRRDGTGLRQVTHPRRAFVTDEPDSSPNGRWILYQREKKGEFPTRLFKIRPNGSDPDVSLKRLRAPLWRQLRLLVSGWKAHRLSA